MNNFNKRTTKGDSLMNELKTKLLRDSTTLEYIDSSIGYSSLSQLYAGGVSIGYIALNLVQML